MIKARIRWCTCRVENILTLGKLLSLWFCFLLHSILFLISQTSYRTYKIISRYELARPIMGTIFLVMTCCYILLCIIFQDYLLVLIICVLVSILTVSSLVIDFIPIVVNNTVHMLFFHQSLSCMSKYLNICKKMLGREDDLITALTKTLQFSCIATIRTLFVKRRH